MGGAIDTLRLLEGPGTAEGAGGRKKGRNLDWVGVVGRRGVGARLVAP